MAPKRQPLNLPEDRDVAEADACLTTMALLLAMDDSAELRRLAGPRLSRKAQRVLGKLGLKNPTKN